MMVKGVVIKNKCFPLFTLISCQTHMLLFSQRSAPFFCKTTAVMNSKVMPLNDLCAGHVINLTEILSCYSPIIVPKSYSASGV